MSQSRPKQVKAGEDGEIWSDLREAVQSNPEQVKAGRPGGVGRAGENSSYHLARFFSLNVRAGQAGESRPEQVNSLLQMLVWPNLLDRKSVV